MNPSKNEIESISPRISGVNASHISDLMRIAAETNLSHWSAQSYLDEMKNPEAVLLRLLTDENSTIGFIVGRFVTGGAVETGFEAEIYNIAVTNDEHGKGLGQMLLDAFLDACRNKHAANIWLEVRESNRKAIDFYSRNGFERVQTRNNFYDNPREHALLLKCVLK